MIYRTVTVTPTLSDNVVAVTADITKNIEAEAEVVTLVRLTNYDEYSGDYIFTPTDETQTIQTDHLALMDNITINPIPNNYGLITWDGSTLMVS